MIHVKKKIACGIKKIDKCRYFSYNFSTPSQAPNFWERVFTD
jgi:ribosomal protein S6